MRIMIIGSGGSGKSTFARKLGEVTGLPVHHLDAYFWRPGWNATPNEEWDEFQLKLVKQDQWIIDGNYGRTIDLRMKAADVIIFLDMSPIMNTYRVLKRRIINHKKARLDMNEGCPEKLDWEFVKWVWTFRKMKRPGILLKLSEYSRSKRIIIIRKHKEVEKILKEIKTSSVGYFKEDENIL